MDYYQGVVTEYLRADRSVFINTECFIQIKPGKAPSKGSSWYCDAVAVDFGSEPQTIFLCEITYSESLQGLIERLKAWNDHWQEICNALVDHSHLPAKDWAVRPWLFVPTAKKGVLKLVAALNAIGGGQELSFIPRITTLEMVQPWEYCNYDRQGENQKLKSDGGIPQKWAE